jgi:hypothetical protein
MQENLSQTPQIFQWLETKLADKTWTDAQDPEFVKSLEQIKGVIESLSAQIYIFVDYFEQYCNAVANSPIFNDTAARSESQSGEVSPTQTPAQTPVRAAANRAERRSKRVTPFQAQGIDNA